MHNVGTSLCLALVVVPLLVNSFPTSANEFEDQSTSDLAEKRGWNSFAGGYGKRGWNSFAGGYGKRNFDYVS